MSQNAPCPTYEVIDKYNPVGDVTHSVQSPTGFAPPVHAVDEVLIDLPQRKKTAMFRTFFGLTFERRTKKPNPSGTTPNSESSQRLT
jgi:hypothetical protein